MSLVHKRTDNDIVSLACKSEGYIRYVRVEASLKEYPQIKIIHDGHRIRVWGEISGIEASGPQVKAHKLEFEQAN